MRVLQISNLLALFTALFFLGACASVKTTDSGDADSGSASIAGVDSVDGVYVGSDTVKELATGVPDRVFFAYDSYSVTTRGLVTLQKQAKWMEGNSSSTVIVQGHCDERGTREYNLALGERRANSAKDYVVGYGIDPSRISTISYGKERPVATASSESAWMKNRRAVTVQVN